MLSESLSRIGGDNNRYTHHNFASDRLLATGVTLLAATHRHDQKLDCPVASHHFSFGLRPVKGVFVLKIRIFALARELGLDSKVLLGLADEAGVALRNALATVSQEERDQIVAYVQNKGKKPAAQSAPPKTATPSREAAAGKTRDIKVLPSKDGRDAQVETDQPVAEEAIEKAEPQPEEVVEPVAEAVEEQVTDAEPAAEATTETTDIATPAAEEQPAEVAPSDEAVASDTETAQDVEESPTDEIVSETAVVEPAPEDASEEAVPVAEEPAADEPVAVETPTKDQVTAAVETKPVEESKASDSPQSDKSIEQSKPAAEPVTQKAASPIQRMKGGGARREMKPIGSVKEREAAKETPKPKVAAPPAMAAPPMADKPKDKPAGKPAGRPLVAAPPSYQPPVIKPKAKKPDEKAMKPEISLDKVTAGGSPLADQLRQLKQAREEHETPGTKAGSRRGARKGSLLDAMRRERADAREKKRSRRGRKNRGPIELKTSAQIEFPITVRALSEAIGRPAKSIMGYFFKEGQMVTINDELNEEDALEVAMELGVDLEIKRGRDREAELVESLDHEDDEDTLVSRPPIITILGHVDHGKTTLVDRLRSANVAGGEAGGITQHIAAYQVHNEQQSLTFVDTPGHAAFGEMRARGANVTDIIVLVIAADDGVMPQTEECISHAKAAGVPIVIALNKMDLPEVDDQRVLQQLAQHELLPAEWGGEYEVVRTSGETGLGMDTLIETLALTAELQEFKANPEREAIGVCLEAFRDEGRGVIAWMIVQKGTLRVGDSVLCGKAFGRIRAMYDDRGNEVTEAGPSTPVKVAGLDEVPSAGVHFFVMKDIEEARVMAESRIHEGRELNLAGNGTKVTLDLLLSAARDGEGMQTLPLILKADSPGSLEAIGGELGKFEHDEVEIQVIHEAVGGVNESDVSLASASGAIIIAFHVIAEERAEQMAEREGVEIRRYRIIYEVIDEIKQSLEGMLRPEKVEKTTGRAVVLQTFSISRFGTIAGCRVINGTISRDNRVHVIRDNTVINDYRMASLKREKDDSKEVREGMECGIRLEGFNDIKEGDLLEAFRIEEISRKL